MEWRGRQDAGTKLVERSEVERHTEHLYACEFVGLQSASRHLFFRQYATSPGRSLVSDPATAITLLFAK